MSTPAPTCEWCDKDLTEDMSPNIQTLCCDCTGEAEYDEA